MATKETAKQRRERERQEQLAAEALWEAERPMRLMHAMARARDLGAEAYVYHRYEDVLYYLFDLSEEEGLLTDPVVELSEHLMGVIEARLDHIAQQRKRAQHLARIKEDLIARLSDDEREALGLR